MDEQPSQSVDSVGYADNINMVQKSMHFQNPISSSEHASLDANRQALRIKNAKIE